jgi:hypothetical protein
MLSYRVCLTFLVAILCHWACPQVDADSNCLLDSGFESLPTASLDVTSKQNGWEVQKTGRKDIQPKLRVACIADATRVKSGAKAIALSLPKETVGFEFVTIGQRVQLSTDREYEVSVWVRWPDGPDEAPKNANATSGHRSAIVSLWVRHRNGIGDFAGRDEWLFDNQWKKLNFIFRPTDAKVRSLVYVSLLPNQKPVDTTLLVDDFELYEHEGPIESDVRVGSLLLDSDFAKQTAGAISPPWYFANIGGTGITGKVSHDESIPHVKLVMGKATSNFESAQMWQHVSLSEGARYEVSCRIRWDSFATDSPAPIVNYGIYHEESRTWYGPVDQVLNKSGDWHDYRFTHVPPIPGTWKLYVQLNGWGNFGNRVSVCVQKFTCQHVPIPSKNQ